MCSSYYSSVFQLYSLIMFPHTGTQLYLLTMSFVPQPTNKQTFRCKADSNWGRRKNLTNNRQYDKTLRVEFTLTKLQEDISEQESLRQITLAHKIIKKISKKAAEKRRRLVSDQICQANQHTKALQKSSKLKTSSGSRLYGKHFKQIWTTSTIFLEDERVLLLSYTL